MGFSCPAASCARFRYRRMTSVVVCGLEGGVAVRLLRQALILVERAHIVAWLSGAVSDVSSGALKNAAPGPPDSAFYPAAFFRMVLNASCLADPRTSAPTT